MKIGLIGRTNLLLETGKLLLENGFEIGFIVTSKEAPEYLTTSRDFKDFAKKRNIPFLHDPAITQNKLLGLANIEEIPLVISINYSGIIPEEVTGLFKLGILNAHGGDLPKYRGNACQAWAIINAEKEIGLCIHRMIGGELDSGDILAKKLYPIDINTRVGQVYDWFDQDIPGLFLKVVNQLSDNSSYILETQSKDPSKALRCYPRRPEDGQIDWHRSAKEIVRLVNASSEPFAGAYCFDDNGRKIIVWRASVLEDDERFIGVAGQIAKINKEKGEVSVLTNSHKLLLIEIEIDGERGHPSKFVKSIRQRLH